MRPVTVTVGSATFSHWIPVNYQNYRAGFSIGLGVILTSGASLTYTVQHTFDDPNRHYHVSITRSGTTATMIAIDHGLSVGDSLIVSAAGAPFDGTYAVASVVDAHTLTYTVANSGLTTASPEAFTALLRVFPHATLAAQTARADGSYTYPIAGLRLVCTSYTSGKASLIAVQAGI